MLKIKKLLIALSLIAILGFSASICANAAQIDCLSIADGVLYAQVDGENARLYAVELDKGLLSDVFFADVAADGNVELPVGKASEYVLYLWDRDSLAPVSCVYNVKDGIAYAEGTSTKVPAYDFSGYSFNQEDAVMVVSEISDTEIKGFKAGVETTYSLTDSVTVLGLSDTISSVVPGSVVLIGTNKAGNCAAIELLASMSVDVNEEAYRADFGVYKPSDGSTKYENIVSVMFSKSGSKLKLENKNGPAYLFDSDTKCYRVGLALMGDSPVVSVSEHSVSDAFKSTAEFNNYVYLRVNTEKSKTYSGTVYDKLITQCIIYSVPKELVFPDDPDDDEDGKYSPIFELEPVVIID